MSSVGILGGTFNPPHIGHLACADVVRDVLALDRVVLMPASVAPHAAPKAEDPGVEHRLAMCHLAAAGDERLSVSDVETRRGGPSYTVDTLRDIHARDPGDELTFIAGGDAAVSLASWREPEALLDLARLAVVERRATRRADIRAALAGLRGCERVVFVDMPPVDVSSTVVRRRVRSGLSVADLVPAPVAEYIGERGLYA